VLQGVIEFLKRPLVAISLLTAGAGALLGAGLILLAGASIWLGVIAAVLTIVFIVLLVLLWRLLAQDREARLAKGISDREAAVEKRSGAATEGALAGLRAGFEAAIETLRDRLGREGVYELPWFLMIGRTASGKSALLRESGLELPADYARMPRSGATPDLDWWLTNDAILLDTAGRYCGSDSEADRKEWKSLLSLLRRHRRERPLDGIVFTITAADLLGGREPDLEAEALQLRRTLNQIEDELELDLPIYIAVTKADLIEGFVEMASVLPPKRLAEAFGWTNPERRFASAADVVARGLGKVRQRLEAGVLDWVTHEHDPERRRRLLLVPEEFGALTERLTRFVGRAFAPSRYDDSPFLRGVYLTSARREGETVPTVLPRLGIDTRSKVDGQGPQRGIFCRDLFREILVEDGRADLTSPTSGLSQRGRSAILGVGGVAGATALAVFAVPFFLNERAITSLREGSERVVAAPGDLAAHDELRRLLEQQESAAPKLHRRLGLGGPMAEAIDRARLTYLESFGRTIEEPTKKALVAALSRVDDTAFTGFAALSRDVRWMESRGAGKNELRPNLGKFVSGTSQAAPEVLANFDADYDAFLRWSPDSEVSPRVDKEKKALAVASARLLNLDQLEAWSLASGELGQPIRYAAVGLPGGSESVPALYSKTGWERLVKGLIASVDGVPGASAQDLQAFRRDYVLRFDGHWHRYLMGTPVAPGDPAAGSRSASAMLIEQIDSQTQIDLPRPEGEPGWLKSVRAVRKESPEEGGAPAPWPRYKGALDQLAADNQARNEPDGVANLQKSIQSGLEISRAIVPVGGDPLVAAKLREILSAPFGGLKGTVEDAALAKIKGDLDQTWRAEVAEPFHGTLDQAKIEELYRPQEGALAKFESGALAPWYQNGIPKENEGRKLPFGPAWTNWMRSAHQLQHSLFGGMGSGGITVKLDGVPSQVKGGSNLAVSRRDLTVTCAQGSEDFTYREGSGSKSFHWSPECQEVSLRVWVRGADGMDRELQPRMEWRGPFALPAFFQEARRKGEGRLEWRFQYPDEGIEIVVPYDLRAGEQILATTHAPVPESLWE